jgi:hypothetical protein
MPSFKDNDYSKRRQAADAAKRATLERFQAQRDAPATAERKATRLVAAQDRASRVQARKAAEKAEIERIAVAAGKGEEEAMRIAAENAERAAVERLKQENEAVARLAEQKAARDSRYAARKARQR